MDKKVIISIAIGVSAIALFLLGTMFFTKDKSSLDGASKEIDKEQKQEEKEKEEEIEILEEKKYLHYDEYTDESDNDMIGLSFYKDTEGFYDFDGVKVGYPEYTPSTDAESDDFDSEEDYQNYYKVGIRLQFLVDKDLYVEDIQDFVEGMKTIKVSGVGMSEKRVGQWKEFIENAKELVGDGVVYEKGDYIPITYDIPYEDIMDVEFDKEDVDAGIFRTMVYDGEIEVNGNMEIDINGVEIELDEVEAKDVGKIEVVPDIVEEY